MDLEEKPVGAVRIRGREDCRWDKLYERKIKIKEKNKCNSQHLFTL